MDPNWLRAHGETLVFTLFFGLFVVLALAERFVPRRPSPPRRRSRWPANLCLTFLNAGVMAVLPVLIPLTFVAMAKWAQNQRWGLLNVVALPHVAALAANLLLRGFISWFTHLLLHKVPLFWRFHRVHHLDTGLDVSTTVRFHPLEFVLNLPVGVLLVAGLGLDPWTLLLYELLDVTVTLFSHANIRIPRTVDRVLRYVLVTPDLHRVHHSAWQPETDSNFSAVFPVWDLVFGTFRSEPRLGHESMELGLPEVRGERANRLFWLLVSPFRWRLSHDAPRAEAERNALEVKAT